MDLFQKSWKATTPPLKKLLSRTITHRLSRKINKTNFEVVYEGFLDCRDPKSEQPDVVIYSKHKALKPAIAIEICKKEERLEMILIAKHLMETYPLKEFFICDYESDKWFLLRNKNSHEVTSSYSYLLSLDLKETIHLFPLLMT